MNRSSKDTNGNTLFSQALRAFFVGDPKVPTISYTSAPSQAYKLLLVIVSWFQIGAYFFSALGGITFWMLIKYWNWEDPVEQSSLLSIVLEEWCILGFGLGLFILVISRRWAFKTGVEWGWMGIRLSLFVFLILFGFYLVGQLQQDIHISLITSVCLFIPARLFWKLGRKTIRIVLGEHVIFLSYRHQDSQARTDHISDSLKNNYVLNTVFQDVEDVTGGEDFRDVILSELNKSCVILVVIGPNWLSSINAVGSHVQQNKDWVRYEIEKGLELNIPIIPLLVNKATMPSHNELPESIKEFAFRNAHVIRDKPDFDKDMKELFESLKPYIEE